MKKVGFILLFFYVFCSEMSAQVSIKDSSVYVPVVGVGYGHYIPGGDLVWRFKNSSAVFGYLDFKLKNYWMLGLNGSYIFGKNVKERLFDSIAKDNIIINNEGDFADVRLYERGFTVSATAGRMFVLNGRKPNCGIVVNIGVGFIQHKIRIEVIGNNVPQLSKEYKKGYDRLSNGWLLSQNLGYLYLSSNRMVNFYIGLECMEGFTQSRRSFDYDKMQRDTKKRLDILYGAKVAWILPLYKKALNEYYTY